MKVVVLNGGKGTRLGLVDRPKPMVQVDGKPLLERLLDVGKASGFHDYVFLNGYLANVIQDYFGDGSGLGVRIKHVRESEPLGTAGAIREVRALLTEPFLVLYGDILIDVDLAHFYAFHQSKRALGTLFVHPNDHPHDSDLVEVDDDGRIRRFLSKPHADGAILPNLVSAALYILDPTAMEHVPETGASDWGKDIFPKIVAAGERLQTYRSIEYAKDIGTPERLAKGEADLASGRVARLSRRRAKPAIFFDRDGVLNTEINGVHRPEDIELLNGAAAALQMINHAGVPAICVTNQPDVAKGFISTETLGQIFAALDTALAEYGVYLDDVYCCPHHPERGWPDEIAELKIACACRKPEPGMLIAAAHEHHLDLARSWMIGDRYVDIAAAHAAGTKAILVRTGYGGSDPNKWDCVPDYVADDLISAVSYALKALA